MFRADAVPSPKRRPLDAESIVCSGRHRDGRESVGARPARRSGDMAHHVLLTGLSTWLNASPFTTPT